MGLRVFINYRREDTAGHAGRLHDALASRIPSAEVFMDVGDIEPGVDFRTAITDAVATCDVMLALIGPRWIQAATPSGSRRLDDPHDYVVAEIAAALERQVRVIPLLIDGARMPRAAELPEPLRGLEHRNGLTLDTVSWPADLDALLAALRKLDAVSATASPPAGTGNSRQSTALAPGWLTREKVLWTAALVAITAVVTAAIILTRDGSRDDGRFEPLLVTPASAPSGSTIEVSGRACPRWPDGEVPDAIYFGLHNPRLGETENPAKNFAAIRPGEAWKGPLDLPAGTPIGRYEVYADCYANDPKRPERGGAPFHTYPDAQFEVTPS